MYGTNDLGWWLVGDDVETTFEAEGHRRCLRLNPVCQTILQKRERERVFFATRLLMCKMCKARNLEDALSYDL